MNDAERMACIEAWSSGSWGDRLGEILRICIAVEQAPTTPLTDEQIDAIPIAFSLELDGDSDIGPALRKFARAVLAAQQEKK